MSIVSWQDAEDALIEAIEALGRLSDRERGFLLAGSRSAWPAIVRDVQADYADVDLVPSAALTRRQMDRLNAVLLGPDAAVLAVPAGHRALVGRVLVLKRWPGAGGFGWDRVWRGEDARSRQLGHGGLAVTSDALRARYDRAVGKVAARMERLWLGLAPDAA